LQAVADAEDGLALAVGVFKEEFVDRVARDICWGGVRRARGVEFCGIDVGLAAGEQDGVAGGDELFCF
jgi:hypothetical protein